MHHRKVSLYNQLLSFYYAREYKTHEAAAERLEIERPAVTKNIKKLQNILGPLFVESALTDKKDRTLSKFGESVYLFVKDNFEYIKNNIEEVDLIIDRIKKLYLENESF